MLLRLPNWAIPEVQQVCGLAAVLPPSAAHKPVCFAGVVVIVMV
jgi:hypothetical protein